MNCALLQGFSPVYPILVLVLLAFISIFLSWWSYQHLTSISALKKYSLISLRGTSLFILLALLLNPFFVREDSDSEIPKIAVLIDNSQSLSVERGNYEGLDSYSELVSEFRNSENENYQYEYFQFDDEVSTFENLNADGFRTNLHTVVEYIREKETEYVASILLSDGIITNGRNPIFAAQNLSIPLITIPVGDTTDVLDIAVTDIDYIETVYTQTSQLITAEIQQQGFEGEETTVQLFKDGSLIDTRTLSFTAETSTQTIQFNQEFTEAGFIDYDIRVPVKENEFTDQNNQSQFTIEVREDKTNILSLAFEIHPDVGSIRRLIATDQQNELFSTTYLGNNRFIGNHPRDINEDLDLIVLHGLPSVDSNLFNWIQNQQTPILFLSLPSTFQILMSNQISDLTTLYLSAIGRQEINVQIEPFESAISHPILEIRSMGIERFPLLQSYRGQYQLSPVSQTLITGTFRGVVRDIPILITEDSANNRKASVAAYGWYHFEQSQNPEVRQFFEQLFTNIVSWTSTSPERDNLFVEPAKEVFSENETVEIQARLYNERGEPEPAALIELELYFENENDENSIFRMTHRQGESYSAEFGNYPQGFYRVRALATKNNRTIGTAETRFRVSQSSAEFLNTKRNDQLLRRLANLTGGIFLQDYNMDRINYFFQSDELASRMEDVREEVIYIHNSAIWFFVVLILLSLEWILRRSVSLP